ncbi:MAG: alpha/beta fold hydrolase [Chloroflexi bacterium]|nr:alpha/beta fold hydrolase [Chloroflexota bacterium]
MTTLKQIFTSKSGQDAAFPRNRVTETAVAVSSVSLIAFLTALTMPYGPITTLQVWIVMVSCLAAGLIAGLALRSPWAMLIAPLMYILVFELARPTGLVPTTGALRLNNSYGLLALVVGRGFHGLVGLLPMVLGAGSGVILSRYLPNGTGGDTAVSPLQTWLQIAPLVILAVIVIGLAVWNGIPASTPPIVGDDGQPIAGSIAELTAVPLGGLNQTILIRAHNADLPVLLYLSGGPGQSDLPYSRVLFQNLTQDFVVVSWDQRGTGKSYPALDPAATLTLDQAVTDTIELTNYLRERFGEEKIYLMGESWGTTLGVLAVQQRPDLYHAFIGSGQMVSQRETDRQLYRDVLDLAARTGDTALAEQMLAFGEPPYSDTPYPNAVVMGYYDALGQPYMPPQEYIDLGTAANIGPWGILASEYSLVEKVNVLRGLIDMFTLMYPQLQEIDFRQDVTKLDVPFYMLDGAAELTARRDLALEWYNQLDAPIKRIYTFDNAGHSVAFEQFTALREIMTGTILPETYPTR